MNGQLHALAALPLVPIGIRGEAGWTPESIWMTWRIENSWPYRNSNSNPSVVQPIASCYTDYAIPSPSNSNILVIILNLYLLNEPKSEIKISSLYIFHITFSQFFMLRYSLLGKNYGKNGTRVSWWNMDMLRAYEDRAQCFVHQYSKYGTTGNKVQCRTLSICLLWNKYEC
jgi:hypothetical protein